MQLSEELYRQVQFLDKETTWLCQMSRCWHRLCVIGSNHDGLFMRFAPDFHHTIAISLRREIAMSISRLLEDRSNKKPTRVTFSSILKLLEKELDHSIYVKMYDDVEVLSKQATNKAESIISARGSVLGHSNQDFILDSTKGPASSPDQQKEVVDIICSMNLRLRTSVDLNYKSTVADVEDDISRIENLISSSKSTNPLPKNRR